MAGSSKPYKIVQNAAGHFEVIGPNGGVRGTYLDRSSAETLEESLNSSAGHSDDGSSGQGSAASSPLPSHPTAFEVASFGDDKSGFGVFGPTGAIEKVFQTRREAETYASDRRQSHEAMAKGVTPPPSTRPPQRASKGPAPTPWIPSPGEKGFVGPLPQSFYPAPPTPWIPSPGQPGFIGPLPAPPSGPQGPTPWIPSPGQPGFIGPMPAPPPGPTPWIPSPGQPGFIGPMPAPAPGPTPWIPSPGMPGFIGPMPASHYPQGPTPWIPSPGQPGFIGPMPAPPAPAIPSPRSPGQAGFIGPLPQSSKDLMDSLRKALDAATGGMPHANGGKFDWTKIGHGIAQGLGTVGGSSTTSGLPQSVIGWAGIGATLAKGFTRELGIIGGMVTVSEGLGKFAENVNESNRRLAPFNGRIASAFSQLEFGDLRRDFRMGAATADTAVTLAKSIDRMRDAWMPLETLQSNLNNRVGIIGAQISRIGGNVIGMPSSIANSFLDAVDPGGQASSFLGRAAGVAGWGLAGAQIGKFFGPWGAAIGGAAGLGVGIIADQLEAPKGPASPWGDFLMNANNLPVLRPQRRVAPPGP